MYKERMFPRAGINSDGQKAKGKICKMCDRKFLIFKSSLENAVASQKLKSHVKRLEQDLDQEKRANLDLVNNRDSEKFRYSTLLENIQKDIEEAQLNSQQQQTETIEKEQALNELTEKKQQLVKETHKREHDEGIEHSSDEEDQALALDTLMQTQKHFVQGIQADKIAKQNAAGGCSDGACCLIF